MKWRGGLGGALCLALAVIACKQDDPPKLTPRGDAPKPVDLGSAEPEPEPEPEPPAPAIPVPRGQDETPKPERELVNPLPTVTPKLAVKPYEYAEGVCSFEVEMSGFPGVDPKGARVLTARLEVVAGEDAFDGMIALRWLDAASGEEVRRVEIKGVVQDDKPESEEACSKSREELVGTVATLMAEIEDATFRSMSKLRIEMYDPSRSDVPTDLSPDRADRNAEGPLQIVWRDNTLVVGPAGATPYVEQAAAWSSQDSGNGSQGECVAAPKLRAVFGDRRAELLAVEYRNTAGPIPDTCVTPLQTALVKAPPPLFDWIERQ